MNTSRKLGALGATLVAVATLGTTLPAAAQDSGNFIVRLRATHLNSANKDDTGLGLSINNKWLPELDLSYFFTPNLAAELILTYPQKQTVHSSVLNADAGTFKHLPPTLTLQYHFPLGAVRPYVGAGINYTNISSVDMGPASNALQTDVSLKHNSWGLAAQVGMDVPIGGGWLVNVDLKKVQIGTTVYAGSANEKTPTSSAAASAGSAEVGKFKVDPWLFSVGFGKRF